MVEVGLLKSPFFTHPSSHTLLHSPSSLIVGFVWKVCMYLVDFVVFVGLKGGPGYPGIDLRFSMSFSHCFF